MCFKVIFDKTLIGVHPAFGGLMNEDYGQGKISAFSYPLLPVLTAESPQKAVSAQWGLIPNWVNDFNRAKKIRSGTVNARSESIHEKPSFRYSWPKKRCVLPVTGFFEPHEIITGSGRVHKESWQISRSDKCLFYLAGIYTLTPEVLLKNEDQRDLFETSHKLFYEKTFSLLTLEATGMLAEIHNGKLRMPFVMTEEQAFEWINSEEGDIPTLLDPYWQMNQEELVGSKEVK